MSRRGQAVAFFFALQLLATDNDRLLITSARHEEAAAWGGGGGRYSPVHRIPGSERRRLRTHRHTWSVTAARECSCQVSGSVSTV